MPTLKTWTLALLAGASVLPACFVAGCSSNSQPIAAIDSPKPSGEFGAFEGSSRDGIERLAERLTGTFRATHTAGNTELPEAIWLNVIPIWPSRTDSERWLYVEQASSSLIDRPERQLIYRVFCAGKEGWANIDGDKPWCVPFPDLLRDTSRYLYCIEAFTLPGDASVYAQAWMNPTKRDLIEALHPTSLTRRSGCEIYLVERTRGEFVGGTRAKSCSADVPHAAYITSKITISSDITMWEQGFADSGAQVWGPSDGGYQFRSVDPYQIMY